MSTFIGPTDTHSVISWSLSDPEQRLAFRGGRFTRVNSWCALLIAAVLSVAFYLLLIPLKHTYFAATFTQRGIVPYSIVVFSSWALAILVLKFFKLRLQQRSLNVAVIPNDPSFVLSPLSVSTVTSRIYAAVDDPRQFVLLNRILIALSNLQNLGRVTDVDEILRSQGESDESVMESSYSLLYAFVWAIPVLGFIGTVQGLSQAIGGFGTVLATSADLSQIKESLQLVTAGLAVAFETTLQGLLAALVVQLLLTALKKSEEEFLDDCQEYCIRNIVGRLRLMAYDDERTS